jgi:hypothetical protein
VPLRKADFRPGALTGRPSASECREKAVRAGGPPPKAAARHYPHYPPLNAEIRPKPAKSGTCWALIRPAPQ